MSYFGIEIIVILVLIIINGVFSMSEIAIISARKARLQRRAEEGDAGAKAAVEIAGQPERFLSTVQIGITLVGILTGAIGGATIAVHLIPYVQILPIPGAYAESLSFGLVVILVTYLTLVIGELVPKRIALNAPESIASMIARPMNFLSRLTAPVVWLLSASTITVLRIFRQTRDRSASVSEEEIKAMILEGTTEGVFEESEQKLMERVFRLDDQSITALMTIRTQIFWIDIEDSEENIRRQIKECPHSRFLVGEGSVDNILGFVRSKNLLDLLINESPLAIKAQLKDPLFIPETATALEVLEYFRKSKSNVAVIVDEFGSTQGLVTSNDILEAIIGDLPVRGIRTESAVQRDDGSWLLDAQLSVAHFCEILKIKELPTAERRNYRTLAGFVIKRLEKLPSTGDRFRWENYRFEVVDMDGNRVDRVLVSPLVDEDGNSIK